jgi:PAS domain-containing protein
MAVIQDLNVRKQAEQALQASKDRLQLALDGAQLGWWEYDPVRHVLLWDGRSREICDYAENELTIEKFLKRTKEAGIGCRSLQALQFPRVIAHESTHDRDQARPIEPSELVERIPWYGAVTVHPPQKAIDDAGILTQEVERPVQQAIVEPCFHKRDGRRTSMLP